MLFFHVENFSFCLKIQFVNLNYGIFPCMRRPNLLELKVEVLLIIIIKHERKNKEIIIAHPLDEL